MRDRPYLDEHSDLVTAGLLAEDVVFATSSLKAGAMNPMDRASLESAKALLGFIVAPEVRHTGRPGIGHLSGSAGVFEALRAAEIQSPDADVQRFLESLIELIDRGLAGEDVSRETKGLEALQQLFAGLGDIALARANSLSVAGEDRLIWSTLTKTSHS